MDYGSGRISVRFLQEIQGSMMRSHDFLAQNSNPNSTCSKSIELNHKPKEKYALRERKLFMMFVIIETKY